MGIAWCRERIEQAQNSKSPVDRILVRCSNVIKPKTSYSHSQGKIVNDFIYKGMRPANLGISNPVPIHRVPPRARRVQKILEYQVFSPQVPDSDDLSKPPVPPPRKKRKRKQTSMEMLNIKLPELHSPSFVLYSENLLNQTFSKEDKETDSSAADVLRPLKKSYYKEKTSGSNRFKKLSGNRTRKNKKEFHSNDEREKIKNDNEKKTEQKIKHVSSVSLPNYNELIKPRRKGSADMTENGDDKNENQSAGLKHPRRNSSSISLPGEGSNSILSSLSEVTIHCLETYMKKCRSFGTLKPQQFLEKLEEFNKKPRTASESSDSWSGLDDWDLGIIEYCDPKIQATPVLPKSTLTSKQTKVTFTEPCVHNCNQIESEKKNEKKSETENEKNSFHKEIPETEIASSIKSVFIKYDPTTDKVPLEWFLNPQLRSVPIMPSPPVTETDIKTTTTPPPTPAEATCFQEDANKFYDDHSTLLTLLREIKDTGNAEPEIKIEIKELLESVVEVPNKLSATYDELNIEISPNQDVEFCNAGKSQSNSWVEKDENKLLGHEECKCRSHSTGFESSPRTLEVFENDKEAVEKEILLNWKVITSNLRRESQCQSLPEDEFEAFLNKKKPSLREALCEFLGFEDDKNNDKNDENCLEAKKEETKKEETLPLASPTLSSNNPSVLIHLPQKEETPTTLHTLVKSNDV